MCIQVYRSRLFAGRFVRVRGKASHPSPSPSYRPFPLLPPPPLSLLSLSLSLFHSNELFRFNSVKHLSATFFNSHIIIRENVLSEPLFLGDCTSWKDYARISIASILETSAVLFFFASSFFLIVADIRDVVSSFVALFRHPVNV